MAYLKSAQDIAELKEFFARPAFVSESLTVEFTTTPEFIREALPPCFEPAADPVGYVSIAQYQSMGIGDFPCGWIFLAMSYQGTEGIFPIASYFADATDITWIREVWGEPGKAAKTNIYSDGDHRYGYTFRHGIRIIEAEADLGAEQVTGEPMDLPSNYFEVKLMLSSRDGGLEFDPVVVQMDVIEQASSYRIGSGSIALRSSPFDPLGEIPVVDVGEASWKVSNSRYDITKYDAQSDRDAYLPWAYADRYWDDPRKLPIPSRFRG
jgi:acetoacetate decarboxylase